MQKKVPIKIGFTLIELLAVIVIIAVIAFITYPLINRFITNSRMSALKSSAESLLRETNLQTAMDKIGEEMPILITDERLNLKNNQFTGGSIVKNKDGKLELKNVTNGSFCINGISGQLTVTKGKCNTEDTTPPILTLQTGYIGATEAMILAKGSDNESGIRGYEYKIGDGSYTKVLGNNFYQFEGLKRNTSYKVTVRVTNGVGLTTEKSITFKTKSISAATFVVSDASKWTNKKDVTINYPTRVSGVIYRYKIGNENWQVLTSGKKKELEVKENTTIYAEVVLNGETVSSSVNVTKIDNTTPIISSIQPNTTSWTRQVIIQINATDTPSGIAGYSFNDGATWTSAPTYTTTKNGTYKIKVKDYANNITNGEITIRNIDRTPPKCVSSGGNNTWTNQSRTIIGTCIDDGKGAGCVDKTVSKTIDVDTNAKMSPGTVKDEVGNETVCPATEMVRVDKTYPTCTTRKQVNTNSVLIIGTCNDTGGSGCRGSVTKTVTENGNYSPGSVTDNVGHTTSCPSTNVTEVDKTPPNCPTVTADHTANKWTKDNVVLTITPTSDTKSWDWYRGDGDGSYTYVDNNTGKKTKTLSNSGKVSGQIVVRDAAGNSRTCFTSSYWIDKVKPLSPKYSGIEISGGTVTSNNCSGKGGTASDVSCTITVRGKRYGAVDFGFNAVEKDQHSGVSYSQYKWNHNGSGTKCPNWFTGNCGNWVAGVGGTFTYTDFAWRNVDNVGNAGYALNIRVNFTWY